jgi:hypothetical protein
LVGALAGVTLQHLFARRATDATHFLTLRTNAYIDFIKGIAAATVAQKNRDSQKEQNAIEQITDAKARVCIYGDAQVVDALADFHRGGPVLDTPERMRAFVYVCQAMRQCGSMRGHPVANSQISRLLLSTDL